MVIIKKVDNREYEQLRIIVKKLAGVELGNNKQYLVESRFNPIMKDFNIDSFSILIEQIKRNINKKLIEKFIDAITTHETLFFRDSTPFDALKKLLLGDLGKKRKLRIWSAAASTGQEAYSIAMIIEEINKQTSNKINYEILATDISEDVLEYAQNGIYKNYEVSRGLPKEYLSKYFTRMGLNYSIRNELKKHITFRKFNLIEGFYNFEKFDLVFCRNVLIYFDDLNKKLVYSKIKSVLNKDGYLFIGSSESLMNYTTDFKKLAVDKTFVYTQND
jgi:chemotaxis protein methyltransferase CheR